MKEETTIANSTFAIGGVSCFADSFVVTESSVLRMNFSTEKSPIANLQNENYTTINKKM